MISDGSPSGTPYMGILADDRFHHVFTLSGGDPYIYIWTRIEKSLQSDYTFERDTNQEQTKKQTETQTTEIQTETQTKKQTTETQTE